jgi:Domain of unknown function (DUF1707)
MSDPTEERRRSIDADIDYFTTRFRARPRGYAVRNRWDTEFMQGGRRMTPAPPGTLRVSDAERNEVADKLSAHFADGRLDESEFKERLDAAMGAKTQADLSGLFDDLPRLPKDGPVVPDDRHRRRRRSFPVLATILIVALIAVASVPPVSWFHVPWFLIGILAIFFWARMRHDRHWHRS